MENTSKKENKYYAEDLILKICNELEAEGEPSKAKDALLLKEKVIYMILNKFDPEKSNEEKKPSELMKIVSEFVQRVNQDAVDIFQKDPRDPAIRIISKAVDITFNKKLEVILPKLKLNDLKLLTLNNLSCIYRQIGYPHLALKAIDHALQAEKKNPTKNKGDPSIPGSLLNKAVIQSELKKHKKSIETVLDALAAIKKCQLLADPLKEQFSHLKYLEMVAYYNMGAENEHLSMKERAVDSYEHALKICQEIKDLDMKPKIEDALKKLKSKF